MDPAVQVIRLARREAIQFQKHPVPGMEQEVKPHRIREGSAGFHARLQFSPDGETQGDEFRFQVRRYTPGAGDEEGKDLRFEI